MTRQSKRKQQMLVRVQCCDIDTTKSELKFVLLLAAVIIFIAIVRTAAEEFYVREKTAWEADKVSVEETHRGRLVYRKGW